MANFDANALRKLLDETASPDAKTISPAVAVPSTATTVSPEASSSSTSVASSPDKKIEQPKLSFKSYEMSLEKAGYTENKDYYFIDEDSTGSLDGLGNSGGLASHFVAPLIKEGLAKIPKIISEEELTTAVTTLIQKINEQLLEETTKQSTISETTLVFTKAFINEAGEHKLLIANIGDSRAYVIRDGNILYQTLDQKSFNPNLFDPDLKYTKERYLQNLDNLVKKVMAAKNLDEGTAKKRILVAAQKITDNLNIPEKIIDLDDASVNYITGELVNLGLTEDSLGTEETGFYPIMMVSSEENSVMTQALGSRSVKPQIDIVTIVPGDLVITCSDGVSGNFTEKELLNIVSHNDAAQIPLIIRREIESGRNGMRTEQTRDKNDDVTLTVLEVGQEVSPKIQSVKLDDLYRYLKYLLIFTQEHHSDNSPVTKKDLEDTFKIHESVSTQLIKKLMQRGILIKEGGPINETNLEKELGVQNPGEVWHFEGEDYKKNPDTIPVVTKAPDDNLSSIFKRVAADTAGGPDTSPAKPKTLETVLLTAKLFDFLIKKANEIKKKKDAGTFKDGDDSLTAGDLEKEFNISATDALTVIKDLEDFELLVNNTLAEIQSIESILASDIEKDFDTLKINHPDVPVAPATVGATATAVPLASPATSPFPSGAPNPATAPATATTKTAFEKLWDKIPKGFLLATAGATAIVVGASLAYKNSNKEKQQTPPATSAPAVKAPAVVPPKAIEKPANLGAVPSGILNPNFKETSWWKYLDPEIKPSIENLINMTSTQAYILPFFDKMETYDGKPITVSEATKIDILKRIDQSPGLLNIVYFGTNYADNLRLMPAPIDNCKVTVKNSETGQITTCSVTIPVALIAKELHRIRERVMMEERNKPLAEETIAGTLTNGRKELIDFINANTKQ